MEQVEYELMAAVEDSMWWYLAAHALVSRMFVLANPPSGPILDAGCGTGGFLNRLSGIAAERVCIGLDRAPEAMRYAMKRMPNSIVCGSANQLPFGDNSFAAIFSLDVLCHRGVDERAALAEATRCLLPGGILIVNLPAYDWLKSTHDQRVHTASRYVRPQVMTLLEEAGLRVRRVTHWNAALLLPLIIRRKLFRATTSDVGEYAWAINRVFTLILATERWWLCRGTNLLFGSSILAVAEKP